MGSTTRNISRRRFHRATSRARFVADHATYLQLLGKSVQFFEGPYEPQDGATRKELGHLKGRYPLTDRLAPWLDTTKAFHCEMSAWVQVTRTGLALLRYRQTHGAFPDTLNALDLDGLIDPYTRKPLCYRNEQGQFIVYSVGSDLTDNGGKEQERHPRKGDDLVWRFSLGKDRAGANDE
jgi:hypothetical protein